MSEDNARVDAIIWKYLGRKPVREIAEMAGVDPAYVLRRKNELIEETDVLTLDQELRRLISEMKDLAARSKDAAENSPMEFKAGLYNSAIAATKTLMNQFERAQSKNTSQVDQLNALRVRELLSLIDSVVVRSVKEITETYSLPENEILEVFNNNLVIVAQEKDIEA